jgi:hypothetical protein
LPTINLAAGAGDRQGTMRGDFDGQRRQFHDLPCFDHRSRPECLAASVTNPKWRMDDDAVGYGDLPNGASRMSFLSATLLTAYRWPCVTISVSSARLTTAVCWNCRCP